MPVVATTIPTEPPLAGDEVATLVGELERGRRLIAWKCGGLDAEGLRATVGVSTMTLGGLLKHLTLVELYWFTNILTGSPATNPFDAHDGDGDPDWEWRTARDDEPHVLETRWRESVAQSRRNLESALASGGLDQIVTGIVNDDGSSPMLRRIVIDMIEEYARHAGHADLLRESVDGLVGEDAPRQGIET